MSYQAWHFTVTPPQPGTDILCAMLGEFPFESFEVNATGFVAYIQDDAVADVDLKAWVFDDFTFSFTIEKIAQTNWNAEWEKNFEPVFVDELLCIRAPFHAEAPNVKYQLVIMPKMSFGTGHHQTTRLVCREMFGLDYHGKRVLDMGCGTGVLAILAARLGATDIAAIDIDNWSVENAKENCSANGCGEIRVMLGGAEALEGLGVFDCILANINKNILKAQLPLYAQHSRPGTSLILSGFFTTDADEMTAVAATCGFSFVKAVSENEWAALVFEKKAIS